jgi:hypothetical protein
MERHTDKTPSSNTLACTFSRMSEDEYYPSPVCEIIAKNCETLTDNQQKTYVTCLFCWSMGNFLTSLFTFDGYIVSVSMLCSFTATSMLLYGASTGRKMITTYLLCTFFGYWSCVWAWHLADIFYGNNSYSFMSLCLTALIGISLGCLTALGITKLNK